MLDNVSFLYVENDPASRQVMELMMKKAMRIRNLAIFEDSRDFLARVKTLHPRPDVILLDTHMQPYDGFEMLRMIRNDRELMGAKVIALTASVMNEEVDELRRNGFNGTISKPLSVTVFPSLMERIVAGEAVWHIS